MFHGYTWKDERISALLDSNNELELELSQKSFTNSQLQNKIASLKTRGPTVDTIQPLINKINEQKLNYVGSFKGKQ